MEKTPSPLNIQAQIGPLAQKMIRSFNFYHYSDKIKVYVAYLLMLVLFWKQISWDTKIQFHFAAQYQEARNTKIKSTSMPFSEKSHIVAN